MMAASIRSLSYFRGSYGQYGNQQSSEKDVNNGKKRQWQKEVCQENCLKKGQTPHHAGKKEGSHQKKGRRSKEGNQQEDGWQKSNGKEKSPPEEGHDQGRNNVRSLTGPARCYNGRPREDTRPH